MWLVGSLPLSVTSAMGAALGTFAWDVLRARRDVCIDNITRSLGVDAREAKRVARASYQNLGRAMMEFMAFKRLKPEDIATRIQIDGLEHLDALRARGIGAVLTGPHMGPWEYIGAVITSRGHDVDFLVGQQTNERVDDLMNDLRRAQGMGIIPRAFSLRKVMQSLKNGRPVAMLVDQDARKGGVVVPFLGRPASTVRGPAMFALRGGAPIVPFAIWREGKTNRGVVAEPLFANPSLDEEAAVTDLTRRMNDCLSDFVRSHPEHYFWPHRRWKSTGG